MLKHPYLQYSSHFIFYWYPFLNLFSRFFSKHCFIRLKKNFLHEPAGKLFFTRAQGNPAGTGAGLPMIICCVPAITAKKPGLFLLVCTYSQHAKQFFEKTSAVKGKAACNDGYAGKIQKNLFQLQNGYGNVFQKNHPTHAGRLKLPNLEKIHSAASLLPFGRLVLSRLIARKAPYTATIRPLILDLEKGYCRTRIKERKALHNHIKTVHSIAMCNQVNFTMGLAVEASLPEGMRWIAKGIEASYRKKAKGTLTATCRFDPEILVPGDITFTVEIKNKNGETVFTGKPTIYITHKHEYRKKGMPGKDSGF